MRQFVAPATDWTHEMVYIRGQENHHLATVLRLRPGMSIVVSNGRGEAYRCCLEKVGSEVSEARLAEPLGGEENAGLDITLALGITRGERFEMALEKAVELGAGAIVPLACRRSVPRWEGARLEKRRERWQKVARTAAKQCGRSLIPEIGYPLEMTEFVTAYGKASRMVVPYEKAGEPSLVSLLPQLRQEDHILVVVGPEGGFAPDEVSLLGQAGGLLVSLGPLVLRSETAAIVALALLMSVSGAWE